jgi:hypothetical protein
MGQGERCANIQVTLETGVRRFSWINDRARSATGLNVQTSGTMARLATHVLSVFTFRLEARMRGCSEIAYDLFVARCAFL